MKRFIFFGIALAIIGCSEAEKSRTIQYFELTDLISDTLFLEKDTVTKNLGINFTHFQTDSGKVLMTFTNSRLLTYSYPEERF